MSQLVVVGVVSCLKVDLEGKAFFQFRRGGNVDDGGVCSFTFIIDKGERQEGGGNRESDIYEVEM